MLYVSTARLFILNLNWKEIKFYFLRIRLNFMWKSEPIISTARTSFLILYAFLFYCFESEGFKKRKNWENMSGFNIYSHTYRILNIFIWISTLIFMIFGNLQANGSDLFTLFRFTVYVTDEPVTFNVAVWVF